MGKILVIDDSAVIRNLLDELLTDMGWDVDLAEDGGLGIELALAEDYAVVFCDIHLPSRDGCQVYREVSAVKPDMPFIMTDSLPDQRAEMAKAAGADYCLLKPFTLEQVREALRVIKSPSSTR